MIQKVNENSVWTMNSLVREENPWKELSDNILQGLQDLASFHIE